MKCGPFPEGERERPGGACTPLGSEEVLSRKLKAAQRSEVPVDYGAPFVDQLHPEVDSGTGLRIKLACAERADLSKPLNVPPPGVSVPEADNIKDERSMGDQKCR